MIRPGQARSRASSSKKFSLLISSHDRAFSLVELLTVMGIVSILASLLLPALTRSREQARSAVCRNNMKQLTYGVFMYAHDKEDDLPTTGPASNASNATDRPEDWMKGGPGSLPSKDSSKWSDPTFAFHAESGSIFFWVTDLPREEVYSAGDRRVFRTYRCPSSQEIGAALRVNYSMNGYLDPQRKIPGRAPMNGGKPMKLSSVVAPSDKVLFVNENPYNMADATFEPFNTIQTADAMFLMHNRSSNYSFFDGSVLSVLGDAMFDVVKTMNRLDRHFDLQK